MSEGIKVFINFGSGERELFLNINNILKKKLKYFLYTVLMYMGVIHV